MILIRWLRLFSLSVGRESERHCYTSHVTFTKSKRTMYKNILTATHATPEDALICGDGLMNDKAKICNHQKFTITIMNHLLKVLGLVVSHSAFSPFYS